MPLPKRKKNESDKKFVERCMDNETMKKEYPDTDQRYAVCKKQSQKPESLAFGMIQDQPWAIHPAKLQEINAFVESRLSGEKIEFEAKTSEQDTDIKQYIVQDNVAIVPLYGVLAKRMNLMTAISGGTSTQLFMRDFQQAIDDPDVKAVVIDVESPGGAVDGTKEAADIIYNSRGLKNIVAYANGQMASAGYWVGSAADAVFTNETSEIGSIGIVLTHHDFSERDKQSGIKRTEIYAGKYKRIASETTPLSKQGKSYLQDLVDDTYRVFLAGIKRNRKVKSKERLLKMAEGRVFIGEKAKKAGLVDGIMPLSEVISRLSTAEVGQTTQEIFQMTEITTKKELSAEYPDLTAQIEKDARESVDVQKIKQEAAQSEQNRILGLAKIQFGADEGKKLETLLASGITPEQLQAAKALNPELEKPKSQEVETIQAKTEALKEVRQSGPENPGSRTAHDEPNFMEAVAQIEKEMGVKKSEAMNIVNRRFPGIREKWLAQVNGQTIQ
jgi:signal peptide peptidase SppA